MFLNISVETLIILWTVDISIYNAINNVCFFQDAKEYIYYADKNVNQH